MDLEVDRHDLPVSTATGHTTAKIECKDCWNRHSKHNDVCSTPVQRALVQGITVQADSLKLHLDLGSGSGSGTAPETEMYQSSPKKVQVTWKKCKEELLDW